MKLYLCDPEKNTRCAKTGCKKYGGNCDATTHEEFAVLKNGKPVMATYDPFLRPYFEKKGNGHG